MTQPDPANLAAAQQLLASLGITPQDLMTAVPPTSRSALTVREFYAEVHALASKGMRRTYDAHWRSLVAAHGAEPLCEVRPLQLVALAKAAKENAVQRDNARDGRGAEENAVAAFRHFFERALDDGRITENPAAKVAKPRRLDNDRRPLTAEELADLWHITSSTGNDPALDTLLHRFHLETGARRGGALALLMEDLNAAEQTVRLKEKGETRRWQPVSKTLLAALREHAESRGARGPKDAVFRQKPARGCAEGKPLTSRRYDNLAGRWQDHLAWADTLHVTAHWLRHSAVAEVERIAGLGVARKFAGHTDESAATTLTYIRATQKQVAAVQAIRTGEPHPLAPDALNKMRAPGH